MSLRDNNKHLPSRHPRSPLFCFHLLLCTISFWCVISLASGLACGEALGDEALHLFAEVIYITRWSVGISLVSCSRVQLMGWLLVMASMCQISRPGDGGSVTRLLPSDTACSCQVQSAGVSRECLLVEFDYSWTHLLAQWLSFTTRQTCVHDLVCKSTISRETHMEEGPFSRDAFEGEV